jgi:hypothetical protein
MTMSTNDVMKIKKGRGEEGYNGNEEYRIEIVQSTFENSLCLNCCCCMQNF